MDALENAVQDLFKRNRRTVDGFQFTVPSPELYPFQWLWDSCFHAIILSHFDIDAAKKELVSVLSHPLPSGLLPHIIYWNDGHLVKLHSWGREQRGEIINNAWQTKGVSSITQPPIIAYALLKVFEASQDTQLLEACYPALLKHFQYIAADRTFNDDALAYIINPDESGEDNSPRFDTAQGLPHMHTADDSLDRRLTLIRENATCNFNAKTCMNKFFGVADVPFNVLYAQDLMCMSALAEKLGIQDDAQAYKETALLVRKQMKEQLRKDALFLSYDTVSKSSIEVLTWAIFMPLYGELLEKDEADQLVRTYLCNNAYFKTPYMVPTTALSEPSYDPEEGFWRGPVWAAPNWFIYHGLKKYGYDSLAEEIKASTAALISLSGFREQYHPQTGKGQGTHDFTWSGLILDMQ